ncbi:MAG: hypothetical protein K2K12_01355 [Clostridia bacterium]|nr:hypothetical protein [Clostridia bacterium]
MNRLTEYHGEFSLCDSKITAVKMTDNSVDFIFGEGLLYLGGNEGRSRSVMISIPKEDFDYNIVLTKRNNFIAGKEPVYVSQPIEFGQLTDFINHGVSIEIFDEIYYGNRMFWRGVVYRHEKDACGSGGEEILIVNHFPEKINLKVFTEAK